MVKQKKKHAPDAPATWEDVEKRIEEQDHTQIKQKTTGSGLLKGLLIFAGALVVALCVMLGIRFVEGRQAQDAADAVLNVYLHKEETTASATAKPAAASLPSQSPAPQETPSPKEIADLEAETQFMFEDDSANVDVTGNYVQPDSPELAELTEATQEAVRKVGEEGVIGIISIPEIKIELPIIGQWSYGLLKISVCRFMGPDVNQPGNQVIIGHNYKNGAHFGKLSNLVEGSEVFLTGGDGTKMRYVVYDIESVDPDDLAALESYEGDLGLTLVTCNNHGKERRVVRCKLADAG